MKISLGKKLLIDTAMFVLLSTSFAFRITGDNIHQYIGIFAIAFAALHNLVNLRWYKNIFAGKYGFKRSTNFLVNFLLLSLSAAMAFSGLANSNFLFGVAEFSAGMQFRQIHALSAYWLLILMAVHIGLHADIVLNFLLRHCRNLPDSIFHIFRFATFALAIFGLWAFYARDMFAKLFLGYSFDFWNPENPAILFFACNFAIIFSVTYLTYFLSKIFNDFKKNKIK